MLGLLSWIHGVDVLVLSKTTYSAQSIEAPITSFTGSFPHINTTCVHDWSGELVYGGR